MGCEYKIPFRKSGHIYILELLILDTQMYKVYRDPEGKPVMMKTQQSGTINYTFQWSDDTYKENIEKLREEKYLSEKE